MISGRAVVDTTIMEAQTPQKPGQAAISRNTLYKKRKPSGITEGVCILGHIFIGVLYTALFPQPQMRLKAKLHPDCSERTILWTYDDAGYLNIDNNVTDDGKKLNCYKLDRQLLTKLPAARHKKPPSHSYHRLAKSGI